MLRGYLGDKVSRIMGYATLRQLRVKQGDIIRMLVLSLFVWSLQILTRYARFTNMWSYCWWIQNNIYMFIDILYTICNENQREYTYMYTHTYIHTHTHIDTHTYIHTHTHILSFSLSLSLSVCVYTHTYTHTQTHTHTGCLDEINHRSTAHRETCCNDGEYFNYYKAYAVRTQYKFPLTDIL